MERKTRNTIIIIGAIAFVVAVGVFVLLRTNKKLKYPSDAKWVKDEATLKMVETLHPKVRQDVANFFTDIEKLGYVAKGTSGLRTTAQQAGLDAGNDQNAEAGLSDHEYGFAIDMNVLKDGKNVLRKASSKSAWLSSGVVEIAKKNNLKWGGDFNSYHDPIHFYNDFGIVASEMPKMKLAGKVDKEGYLIV